MAEPDPNDEPLLEWKQGDFALNVGGFLFANTSDSGEYFDPEEDEGDIVGLVVISQTCDIVRRTGGRHFVSVCALTKRPEAEVGEVISGRRPYFAVVENADVAVFADLRKIMSVSKDLLRTWDRQEGFESETGRVKFANSLERKFGQFAFPDDFDRSMSDFKKRVWRRHDKTESLPGKVYRSLLQIRFKCEPDWDAANKKIRVLAILREPPLREASRDQVAEELETSLAKVVLPDGYSWSDNDLKFILATAKNLNAADLLSSRRADFDFLCV